MKHIFSSETLTFNVSVLCRNIQYQHLILVTGLHPDVNKQLIYFSRLLFLATSDLGLNIPCITV